MATYSSILASVNSTDRGAWLGTGHGVAPDKNTGVGYHALLHGIFPTQGSNPGLLHCRWILYQVSYKGSPATREVRGETLNVIASLMPRQEAPEGLN